MKKIFFNRIKSSITHQGSVQKNKTKKREEEGNQ